MYAQGMNFLLVAIPLLLVLFAAVLRLDEHVFSSRQRRKTSHMRPRFAVTNDNGEEVFTDPDGRPFRVEKLTPKSQSLLGDASFPVEPAA